MVRLNQLSNIAGTLASTPRMPVLFIGHGNPMNAIWNNPYTQSLRKLGDGILLSHKPKAIMVVSAHWLTSGSYVNMSKTPEVLYDFRGFPNELFKVKYSAAGAPLFAKETSVLSNQITPTTDWGLDHGAWGVLKHLFPDATIPVYQLSIDYGKSMQYHFDLAKQLQTLREKGVLVLGSGNIVHNLRLSMQNLVAGGGVPYDWAIEFDEWVKQKLDARDFDSLISYEQIGLSAKLSVPTVDHYVPLLYALGLASDKEALEYTFEGIEYGGLSMRCFKIG